MAKNTAKYAPKNTVTLEDGRRYEPRNERPGWLTLSVNRYPITSLDGTKTWPAGTLTNFGWIPHGSYATYWDPDVQCIRHCSLYYIDGHVVHAAPPNGTGYIPMPRNRRPGKSRKAVA